MTTQEIIESRRPFFEFSSVKEYVEAQRPAGDQKYFNKYHRDGFPALGALENQIGELIGADKSHTFLCNSGLSAVLFAIELAYPTADDVVVHGLQEYSQTSSYINKRLVKRRIRAKSINPGSIKTIDKAINTYRPKIVLFETIANGTEMAVLDVERFLDLPVLKEVDPLIILDNTLPTDSNLPLADILRKRPELKAIGTESATKFYALNKELGGIIFSFNEEIASELEEERKSRGLTPGPSTVKTIEYKIPPSKEQFDSDNRLTAWNTLQLAKTCKEAEKRSGKFVVVHPNLPDHPNYDFTSIKYPRGSTPVFFIQSTDPGLTNIALSECLLENKKIKEGSHFSQSFGFAKTGIHLDAHFSYVRIAGGLEDPYQLEEIKKAFYETLSSMN